MCFLLCLLLILGTIDTVTHHNALLVQPPLASCRRANKERQDLCSRRTRVRVGWGGAWRE